MKRTIRRAVLLWMLAALLWVLSACGMNNSVEDMFTLPRVPDEYTGLNQQIEQMISGGYEYAAPTAGQNIQSVQMVDLNGDGTQVPSLNEKIRFHNAKYSFYDNASLHCT